MLPRQVHQQLGDRGRAVPVEAGRRLVREQQRRLRGERARDRHAGPLARRQPRDRAVQTMRQPDGLAGVARGCAPVANTSNEQPELDVLACAEERNQPALLGHDAHVLPAQRGETGPVEPAERLPEEFDLALVGAIHPGEQSE